MIKSPCVIEKLQCTYRVLKISFLLNTPSPPRNHYASQVGIQRIECRELHARLPAASVILECEQNETKSALPRSNVFIHGGCWLADKISHIDIQDDSIETVISHIDDVGSCIDSL